jgi:hypothetical protein
MNIMDKMIVFSIRHQTSKEKILQFEGGKQLLAYTMQIGMGGAGSLSPLIQWTIEE